MALGKDLGMEDSASVLHFWFEESTPKQWFTKDADYDRLIEQRFGALHAVAAAGKLDNWAETADGALALILVPPKQKGFELVSIVHCHSQPDRS